MQRVHPGAKQAIQQHAQVSGHDEALESCLDLVRSASTPTRQPLPHMPTSSLCRLSTRAPIQGLPCRLGAACLTCSHTSTSWLADLRYSDSTATPTPRLNTALYNKPNHQHSQARGTHTRDRR